jgi:hypothetical protein
MAELLSAVVLTTVLLGWVIADVLKTHGLVLRGLEALDLVDPVGVEVSEFDATPILPAPDNY